MSKPDIARLEEYIRPIYLMILNNKIQNLRLDTGLDEFHTDTPNVRFEKTVIEAVCRNLCSYDEKLSKGVARHIKRLLIK